MEIVSHSLRLCYLQHVYACLHLGSDFMRFTIIIYPKHAVTHFSWNTEAICDDARNYLVCRYESPVWFHISCCFLPVLSQQTLQSPISVLALTLACGTPSFMTAPACVVSQSAICLWRCWHETSHAVLSTLLRVLFHVTLKLTDNTSQAKLLCWIYNWDLIMKCVWTCLRRHAVPCAANPTKFTQPTAQFTDMDSRWHVSRDG